MKYLPCLLDQAIDISHMGLNTVLGRKALWEHCNIQAVHGIITGLGPAGSGPFRRLDSQDRVGQVGMEAEEKGKKHIRTLSGNPVSDTPPGTFCSCSPFSLADTAIWDVWLPEQ